MRDGLPYVTHTGRERKGSIMNVVLLFFVMSQDGDTPLQLATVRQETEIVGALLEAGAKPNEVQNKQTHQLKC